MFIADRVEVALQILDVLNRADCEYVPLRIFSRVYHQPKQKLTDTLHILKKAGVVKTERGRHGGYAFNRAVTLYELVELFSPSSLPCLTKRSCNYRVDTLKKNLSRMLFGLTIEPRLRDGEEQIEVI